MGVCSLNLAFHSARAQRKLPFPRRAQSLTKIKWLLQNTNRDERSNISMFCATDRVGYVLLGDSEKPAFSFVISAGNIFSANVTRTD